MAYSTTYRVRDALLQREAVLGGDVKTDPIDLGALTNAGSRLEEYELRLWADASPVSFIGDTNEIHYILQFSNDKEFANDDDSIEKYICNKWIQTGTADGAEAMENLFRVPTKCPRYVRLVAQGGQSAGNPNGEYKFGLEVLG
jgi:hypothetical protein